MILRCKKNGYVICAYGGRIFNKIKTKIEGMASFKNNRITRKKCQLFRTVEILAAKYESGLLWNHDCKEFTR